jgi:bacterial/archaeal transporter family protein
LRTWVDSWPFWALLSASFAALTAIFAKIGVENINSDLAILLRTAVIATFLAAIVAVTRQYQPLASILARTYAFLTLSGLATGASWLCYFRALKLGDAPGSRRLTSFRSSWSRSLASRFWASG